MHAGQCWRFQWSCTCTPEQLLYTVSHDMIGNGTQYGGTPPRPCASPQRCRGAANHSSAVAVSTAALFRPYESLVVMNDIQARLRTTV